MKVSVAMATYNGERFLLEQLQSLAEQTRLPDELVVTDDGSSDGTLEVLRAFAQTAPFEMRVVANDANLGFAQNFGKALSLCTGDVIMPCDQDDFWFKDKIATMLAALEASPDMALILCDTTLTDGALRPVGTTKRAAIRHHGLPDEAHVMGCCMAIRRSFLTLALPVPRTLPAHDNWIAQLGDAFETCKRLDQSLLYHRLHESNVSDYYVNEIHALSPAQRLVSQLRRLVQRVTGSRGLSAEHTLLWETCQRLEVEEERFAALFGQDRVAKIRAPLSDRIAILDQRLAIRNKPRPARLALILALWRAGGYGTGRGVIGAVKDLFPATPSREVSQE